MDELRLHRGALADVRRAVEETAVLGGVRALREAGRRLAADAEVAICERAGRQLPGIGLSDFWSQLDRYLNEAGWGHIEHQDLNPGVAAVVASDWVESDPAEARTTPGCHISTGLLAELLSRAAGRPVAVLEVNCRSRGDPVCRFLFGAPTTLLLVHRKLAEHDSLDDALAAL